MSVHGGAPDAAAHPGEPPEAVTEFLRLSVILTGFEEFELLGTGMLMPYYDELLRIIGAREVGALLGALSGVALSGVALSGWPPATTGSSGGSSWTARATARWHATWP